MPRHHPTDPRQLPRIPSTHYNSNAAAPAGRTDDHSIRATMQWRSLQADRFCDSERKDLRAHRAPLMSVTPSSGARHRSAPKICANSHSAEKLKTGHIRVLKTLLCDIFAFFFGNCFEVKIVVLNLQLSLDITPAIESGRDFHSPPYLIS